MVNQLLDLLDLEVIDRDVYRGTNPPGDGRRIFGGQVAAQALRATTLTVPAGHDVNSLHAYFLRPGRPGVPIVFLVDRIRDGRSFMTRRVVARQDGEAIFNLDASFHRSETGPEYQLAMVEGLPDPDSLGRSHRHGHRHGHPIDVREIPSPPGIRRRWIRSDGEMPEDPCVHACLLAYASDMGAVGVAAGPLDNDEPMMRASLDHAMWFHRPVRADEWLLYEMTGVMAARARGLVWGGFFTRDGVLAVSVSQEALLRPIDERRDR